MLVCVVLSLSSCCIWSYLCVYICPGPFGSSVAPDSALQQVSELCAQLEALKEEQQNIRYGLNIFNIEQPASKDILILEKVPITAVTLIKTFLRTIHHKNTTQSSTTECKQAEGDSMVLLDSKLNNIDTVGEGHFWFSMP